MIEIKTSDVRTTRRDYGEFRKWLFDPTYEPRIGGFTRKLFDLLGSADPINLRRIAIMYPAAVYVFMEFAELDLFGFKVIDD